MDRGVKHIMRQSNGRALRDIIPRKEGQFHAFAALGHAVAHGGHAARDLRRRTVSARGMANKFGEFLKWRMSRQHIIIGCHNADIWPFPA